ncbi:hypothetical protein [Butyricicoccus sp. Marseille-Q5471]|uniref:hypothetical protein n=1 Tax=Butyricicoccus sp. Marseille-Q5471 TaxID=3039493 RepID=UPI0024BD2D68|nr:hypothetical protein [Butyricicoccus sp. Marseille-Q5471]
MALPCATAAACGWLTGYQISTIYLLCQYRRGSLLMKQMRIRRCFIHHQDAGVRLLCCAD